MTNDEIFLFSSENRARPDLQKNPHLNSISAENFSFHGRLAGPCHHLRLQAQAHHQARVDLDMCILCDGCALSFRYVGTFCFSVFLGCHHLGDVSLKQSMFEEIVGWEVRELFKGNFLSSFFLGF